VAIAGKPQSLAAAVLAGDALTTVNARTGRDLRRYPRPADPARSLALAEDGLRAVCGTATGKVLVWDLRAAQAKELAGHAGAVGAVALSPDGKRAVSGGADGTVRLWDLAGLKEVGRFSGGGEVTAVAVTPDGRQAVTGGADGTVRVLALP
jgi:WD40 repeat protein